MPSPRHRPAPLTADSLERLALRYVERFATTQAKLAAYLTRKVRERGWDGAAVDVPALAERFAARGYVDDRAYADAKTTAMLRRGLGARRIAGALRAAGIGEDDTAALKPQIDDGAEAAALAYARRRRIGPFATVPPDRAMRERQIAALVRAGHSFALAQRIVALEPDPEGSQDAADLRA